MQVLPGMTLNVTGSIFLKGALKLVDETSVVASNGFTQFDTGLMQGSGTVLVSVATLHGNLAPGSQNSSCFACLNSRFLPEAATVGTFTFVSAFPVILDSASLYLKALTNGQHDLLVFQGGLVFSGSTTQILVDVLDGSTGTLPFISSPRGITVQTRYVLSARSALYPWQAGCIGLMCPSSCTGGTCAIDPGTGPNTNSLCPASQATSISIMVGPCGDLTLAPGPACNPTCVNGMCNTNIGVCLCNFDAAQSFGWSGTLCDTPWCLSNCGGAAAGTCATGAPFPRCACHAPYSGVTCASLLCQPTCLNGGKCVAGTAVTSVCDCLAGFTGSDCATVVPPGQCPPCGANGQCGGAMTGFSCVCNVGWSGSACNVPICPGFIVGVAANCNGNGLCSGAPTPSCLCSPGWNGTDCAMRVCSSTYCQNGGTCQASGSQLSCACAPGWTGTTCTLRTTTTNAGM